MFFLLSYLIGMCYSVTVQSHADSECFRILEARKNPKASWGQMQKEMYNEYA